MGLENDQGDVRKVRPIPIPVTGIINSMTAMFQMVSCVALKAAARIYYVKLNTFRTGLLSSFCYITTFVLIPLTLP
jgi:hypothetical protein